MIPAICPGSFDPITLGHLDVIRRAAAIFGRVTVLVMDNSEKKYMFPLSRRIELASLACDGLAGVEVAHFGGLLAEYTASQGAVLVKGVRNASDYDYEVQLAAVNRGLTGAETLILPCNPAYAHISSSVVREMIKYRAPLTDYLPHALIKALSSV